jgi:hypothetical protein
VKNGRTKRDRSFSAGRAIAIADHDEAFDRGY